VEETPLSSATEPLPVDAAPERISREPLPEALDEPDTTDTLPEGKDDDPDPRRIPPLTPLVLEPEATLNEPVAPVAEDPVRR